MTDRFDYTKARGIADALLVKFGRLEPVIIRRTTTSGPPHDPTVATQDNPATAAIVNYRLSEMLGTSIQMGDRKALISVGSTAVQPTTQDKLVVDGNVLEIVNVDILSPAGTDVLYIAQVRG